jgi:lambda family phage portal protein
VTGAAKILQHPASIRRAYESAGLAPALASWVTSAVPPDVDIHGGLRQLRARSRDAAQNDDHMISFLGMVERNVIGHAGIGIQPKPRTARGGIDKALAARLEAEWATQCQRGNWETTGQLSHTAASALGVRAVAQDGEHLLWIHESNPDAPTGFYVELLDAEALDLDYNALLPNGNVVRMGVEMTRRRRPVAYWLFQESANPYGGYASHYGASQRVRVPAAEIIHVFLPRWVWGSRGIPWARTALKRMKMLGGYEEAAITASRLAAAKSAAYTSDPEGDPNAAMAGQQQSTGTFTQTIEPGMIEQVPYGWKLDPLDWQWPAIEHGAFIKAALRAIACGLEGISYNLFANDLEGVNFSSLRQGALSERDLWMALQGWWIEWVEQTIYQRWATYMIRSGRVTRSKGFTLPLERLPDLCNATYQGRRWAWFDPIKDIQSNKEQLRLRTKSVSSIIREAGGEPADVWAELAEDIQTLNRLGIPLDLSDKPAVDAEPAEAQEGPETAADPADPEDQGAESDPQESPDD